MTIKRIVGKQKYNIRNVELNDIVFFCFPTMRFIVMFITTVCVLFLVLWSSQLDFNFTCPLAPSWRIGPPHVLSIDSCLALQCAPLSRTATLLWTSPFLLCAARLFLSGCCLRMCPINRHLLILTSSLNLSTLALPSSSLLLILPCHLIFIILLSHRF